MVALNDHGCPRHPDIPFCRYADDGILHCRTEDEANAMREHLDARLRSCKLGLHPDKTRVVYCKDSNRRGEYENVQFDFLGYTFRPRAILDRNERLNTGFTPALSRTSMKSMCQSIRRRQLHHRSEWSLDDLARAVNPQVRGWMGYYCRFRGSAFHRIADHLDRMIVRWAMRKHKRLRSHYRRTRVWLGRVRRERPSLFVHWSGRGAFAVGTMGAR